MVSMNDLKKKHLSGVSALSLFRKQKAYRKMSIRKFARVSKEEFDALDDE